MYIKHVPMIAQKAEPQKVKQQQQSDKPKGVDHSVPLKKQQKVKPLKKGVGIDIIGNSQGKEFTHTFVDDQKDQARQEGMSLSYVFPTELAYNTSMFIYFQNRSSFI